MNRLSWDTLVPHSSATPINLTEREPGLEQGLVSTQEIPGWQAPRRLMRLGTLEAPNTERRKARSGGITGRASTGRGSVRPPGRRGRWEVAWGPRIFATDCDTGPLHYHWAASGWGYAGCSGNAGILGQSGGISALNKAKLVSYTRGRQIHPRQATGC